LTDKIDTDVKFWKKWISVFEFLINIFILF
jgi:hypothetical protein